MLCIVSALGFKANAQGTWTAPVIPGSDISTTNTGNYAIYNVKADAFMGEGMNYNTEAIACRLEGGYSAALAARQKFTLSVSNGNVKMIHVNHTDNGKGVGCASTNANDIYADYASNNQWAYASSNTAPDYGNVYNLSLTGYGTLDVDDKWGGKLTTKSGKGFTDWAFIPESSLTDGSFAKWVERKAMYDVYLALDASSSTSTYVSALETANAVYVSSSASVSDLREATRALILATAAGIQQPTNVSALFTNANMQQDGTKDWTSDNVDRSAGAIENHWASTAITLTQEQTDVPNGMYTLVFRGMYRAGSGDTPYFKAVSGTNEKQVDLPLMSDMASRWSVRGTGEWVGDDNNKIPNKLWRAAEGLAYEGASANLKSFKVTGNTLTLTAKVTSTAQWVPFQCFDIIYEGPTNLALYNQILAAKATAEAIDDAETTDAVQDALDHAIAGTAGLTPISEEDALNDALDALNTAIGYYEDTKDSYASYNALKASANGIAAVEYTETTSGSHATYASAISTQTAAVEGATAASAITTATSTLKAAIKTYISKAEPKNDGESFEITCLVTNPKFADNTTTGWTRTCSGGNAQTTFGCNEFWNNTFNFYQDLAELPNGSYQLSVQAFCRPGDNGDLGGNKKAYYDYTQGVNNVTAELYVNDDASRVGNIYAYTASTSRKHNPGTWEQDYECVVDGGTNYFVPNCMEGASKYFADEDVYKTEVAALVDNNTLRIGFRDESLTAAQWTIFTNFRLYYYGSSKLVYYKQYLPQLKAEVTEDLANAAYDNVTGKERGDLETANAATPASETEEAYKTVIDDIKEKQTAFKTAKTSYDEFATAKASSLTKFTNNIGTGVFQYNETTNNTLYSAYETQKAAVDAYTVTSSSTASAVQALVDAYNDAVDNYNNQPLNAPDAETRYVLTIVEDGKDWNGNAVTFREGDANETEGNFGIKYQTTTNVNYNQAIKFTATSGNKYKLSVTSADGTEMYLTTQKKGYNKDDGGYGDERIRMTNDASKALEVEIRATSTDNQFQLYNSTAPGIIANSNNNDMYTANSCNFTIAEASKASATVRIQANKYGTIIFPFTPDVSKGFDGITFYSCSTQAGTTVEIEPLGDAPVANTPYIVRNANGDLFEETLSGWGAAYKDSYDAGLLTGIYTAAEIPVGSYVLQTQSGVQGFYQVKDAPLTGVAYRAYLTVPAASAKSLMIVVPGQATDVTAPEVVETEEPEVLFNLAGIPVGKDFKGVVINQKGEKRLQNK